MNLARLLALFVALTPLTPRVTAAADPLAAEFAAPPLASRPSIWWYWGESVTTDEGITADLESLRRVGFGGVVVYEQVFADRPDAFKSLSPEWLGRFRHAAAETARLGLKLEVNVSGGFVAGGPWITPALGMQRLVASELTIDGGKALSLTMPQPPTRLGYYRDVALLAYPAPAGDSPSPPPPPVVSVSPVGALDAAKLFGHGGREKVRVAPPSPSGPVLVRLDYASPVTLRGLSYDLRANSKSLVIATQVPTSWADDAYGQAMRLIPPIGAFEVSDDGAVWRRVRELPAIGQQHDSWERQTLAFPAVTARHFRLRLENWGPNPRTKDDDLLIGNVALHASARVDQWERKSGQVVDFSNPDLTPAYAGEEVIDPASIIDLSDRLQADGRLEWTAPPGRWTLLRFGHTPTGAKTKHGRPETMGLECDKLNAAAVRVQFENYVGRLLAEVRAVPGARLAGVGIDSNEHGSQNWTAAFPAAFLRRRGYDPKTFLPAMAGRVVGNRERTDRFLHDVRRTIADLMSDEYFGEFERLCRAEGMTSAAQAPGIATCLPSDNLQAKARVSVPMGEFWMSQPDGTIDCKEAASAAHVYGLPVAAAESFTGSRDDAHPAMMKPFADAALALGINHFVVLAYVHQPRSDRLPGVAQDRFYVPYQRLNTWWEDSVGFWTTLGRSAHLLRQGRPAADLLYHLGGDTPLKIATARMRPVPPEGYDYDVCNDEVLLTRTRVEDGRVVLPDGVSYPLLVLAGGPHLSLPALRQVRELVRAGATVLGPHKPSAAPGLADGPDADAEIARLADELWGPGQPSGAGEKTNGAGRLVWGRPPAEVLAAAGVAPDFHLASAAPDARVRWIHRRLPDREVYFIANARPRGERLVASFRATGHPPELWDPATGGIFSLPGARVIGDATEVPLTLEPHASAFVVFRTGQNEAPSPNTVARPGLIADLPVLQTLPGPWRVRFTPGWEAPEEVILDALVSWPEHPEPGVRDYSGAARYTLEFEPGPRAAGARVFLDLGEVGVLASVRLNDHDLGVVWKKPYAVDATAALRPGRNVLSIRVVNPWTNRLIADSGRPEAQRKTWTTYNPRKPGDRRLPSGLIGPVTLRLAESSPPRPDRSLRQKSDTAAARAIVAQPPRFRDV